MTYASVLPRILSFEFLKEITGGFSKERKLGSGAYGEVYMGVQKDGTTFAVKRLSAQLGLDDEQLFRREFENLALLEHKNIVRLVGYCYKTQRKYKEHEGKKNFDDETNKVLCFEYMPKGSLDKHLDDESHGHGWCTRYAIIKGICEGLKYLHVELGSPLYHLDLKPANVLLDENMMPKIADFGLSRFFREEKTRTTASPVGTRGYLPPEYIDDHKISDKFDIFSLGVVMIKIMTGSRGYFKSDMSREEFIERVHGNWMNRLHAESVCASQSYSEQIKRCIEIALSCVETERKNRPSIGDIVSKLNETETMIHKLSQPPNLMGTVTHALSQSPNELKNEPGPDERRKKRKKNQMSPSMPTGNGLLDVHSCELRFPFEPDKLVSCELHLTNNTDDRVAFRCVPENRKWYVNGLRSVRGYLNAKCSRTHVVTMREQKHPPASMDALAVILESCVMHKDARLKVDSAFSMAQREESGGKVHKVTLVAVCGPADDMTSEPPQSGTTVISYMDSLGEVRSIDVHPTQPWILTGHDEAYVSIRNYQTQKIRVIKLKLTERGRRKGGPPRICSAKFIARQEWFVVGDGDGYIRVRTLLKPVKEVKEFKAHESRVNSLAVHPNHPLVLSASRDHLIKLWNWETGWTCMMTYKAHSGSVHQVVFNPQNDITFASASSDSTVKIWSVLSPNPVATFPCDPSKYACIDYFFPRGDRQYIITGSPDEHARIWDLRTERFIKTLPVQCCNVVVADCLQDHPILVTASKNKICLWNSNTYRTKKIVRFDLGNVHCSAYIKCIRSLAIGFANGIGIMKID